jgi:hypothetical protein
MGNRNAFMFCLSLHSREFLTFSLFVALYLLLGNIVEKVDILRNHKGKRGAPIYLNLHSKLESR